MKKIKIIASALAISLVGALFVSCGGKKAAQDVIRISISSEPDAFFPWKAASSDSKAIIYNIYDSLTFFDADGKIIPQIAKNWSVSEDGLVYTFNLESGIKFHDGSALTEKDVLYTYKNMAGLDGYTVKNDSMTIVSSVESPEAGVVVITLKSPSSEFVNLCATCPVVKDGATADDPIIGSGPYKFVSYDIHNKVVLERNDEYWNNARKGKIKTAELYVMTNESATLSALSSNQIDVAQLITPGTAKAMSSNFTLVNTPQNMVQILAMNNLVKPFDDIRVRKAISMAVNKKEIIAGVMDSSATELYSNFSPIMKSYYNDELKNVNPYDPDRAKALLAEAGYPKGFEMTITVPSNYQAHMDTAQVIVNNLAQIGIKAKIEGIEWTTWLSRVYTQKDYETSVIAFGGKLEPSNILRRYYSTYKRNFVNYKNPAFDKAFDEAFSALTQEEQTAKYKECQKYLAEDAPAVFICDPNNAVLTQKNVKGYVCYPVVFYDLSSYYFE